MRRIQSGRKKKAAHAGGLKSSTAGDGGETSRQEVRATTRDKSGGSNKRRASAESYADPLRRAPCDAAIPLHEFRLNEQRELVWYADWAVDLQGSACL